MSDNIKRGALQGYRIIDFTQGLAGPFGSLILGDLGAEILKIEPPDRGDLVRDLAPFYKGESYYIIALGRNKKGVTLDLRTTSGKAAFYDLVRVSDVVFDNFRSEVMKKLGADYDTLKTINRRVICCSLSGYGSSGPYAGWPSYDDIACGLSGITSLTGEPGKTPVRVGVPIADLAGGMFSAIGIIAALCQREKSGEGQKIETSLLDSALALMAQHLTLFFLNNKVPPPQGTKHPTIPLVGTFRTKNGFIALGPSWPRIARVVGLDWMIDDPRFATPQDRFEHKKELEDLIEGALQKANTEDWLELLHIEDIGAGPVYTLDKVVEDPQVLHNQMILSLEHTLGGVVKMIGCPIKMGFHEKPSSPPTLGQHTREVLSQILGYSEEMISNVEREAAENKEERERHVRKRY